MHTAQGCILSILSMLTIWYATMHQGKSWLARCKNQLSNSSHHVGIVIFKQDDTIIIFCTTKNGNILELRGLTLASKMVREADGDCFRSQNYRIKVSMVVLIYYVVH